MRLLLDECVPRPLLHELTAHDAHHVVDLGWSSKRNGELLKLMLAERCEALFTVDRSLAFQQNVLASGIAVVVAIARTDRVRRRSCRRYSMLFSNEWRRALTVPAALEVP